MENNEKFYEEELNKAQAKKTSSKPKKKGLIARIVAIGLAAVFAIGATIAILRKKIPTTNEQTYTITSTYKGVDDLGFKDKDIDNDNKNKQYGNVTGDIKKEELVSTKDKNGNTVIYKDQDAADKSSDVGKEVVDTQNGALEVQPDGTVVEKNEGFEVKDETGNVVASGSNESGIPDGYVYDSVLNKYVKAEDVGKYVIVEATYYDNSGNVVYNEGEIVLKETYEKIKKELTVTKPENTTTDKTVNTNTTTDTNTDKETTNTNTPSDKETTNTETKNETVDSMGGVVNIDGTYTIYGTTYMDKATFEAFVLDENATLNFGYYNGVVYPKSVIDEMSKTKSK